MSLKISFPGHPSIERFLHLANSEEEALRFADVTLVVAQRRLRCHRLLLAAHSAFLRDLLLCHHQQQEEENCTITLADADFEEVEDVLAFVYSGKVSSAATLTYGLETLKLQVVKTDEDKQRPKRKRVRNKWLDDDTFALNKEEEEEEQNYDGEEVDGRRLEKSDNDEVVELSCDVTRPGTSPKRKKKKKQTRVKNREPESKRNNKENLECCDKKFEDEIFYATHKVKVHSEMPGGSDQFIICCDEKIFGTFKGHLQAIHKLDDETDKSNCCDNSFEDLNDLTAHCASYHGLKLSTFKGVLCCAIKLNSLEEYKRHKEEDSAHLECSHCAFITTDERHLELHLYAKHNIGTKTVDKALTCKYCDKTFKRVHLRQDHEDKHDDKLKYKCPASPCGKSFRLVSSLRSHLYRMGKNHDPDLKIYSCDTCSESFNTVVAKRKHTRMAHEHRESPKCTDCEVMFVDRHSLDNHVKVAHVRVKDVQCTTCGKLFATQDRMRVHERFVHVIEQKKVPCDLCGKEFSNKERMIDHRRSVHRDRKYQCHECGSTFKNSSTLKSHVVSIHLDHEKKPLKCGVCGKGFLHESRLRAHEMIHGDEAPFNCQFCGRPNKCKNNNLKHEKRCKKAKVAAGVDEQQQPSVGTTVEASTLHSPETAYVVEVT